MKYKVKEERYNPFVFKLEAEGEIKTVDLGDDRKAKTMIDFVPYNDTVIVRGIFEEKAMSIVGLNEQKVKQLGSDKAVVVAVGPEVKDIEVGHVVAMPYNPGIQNITIPDNPRSIEKTIKYFKDKKTKETSFASVKMVEYVIAPSYAIKGSFGKETIKED